jgi:hypothetical protein
MDCPNGDKIIEWQYPGGEKQRILGGDSYSLNRVAPVNDYRERKYVVISVWMVVNGNVPQGHPGYPLVDGQLVRLAVSGVSRYNAPIWQVNARQDYYSTKVVLDVTETSNDFNNGVCYKKPVNGNYLQYDNPYNGSACNVWYNPSGFDPSDRYNPRLGVKQSLGIQQINIVTQTGSSPSPCVNQIAESCTLNIIKNGQTVYQKVTPVCPIVAEYCGEKCPEGTCECTCGSEVCCYDTKTGKAVKSFRR